MSYVLTEEERLFVAKSPDPLLAAALVSLAAAWNRLDTSVLEAFLDATSEYASQSVEEVLVGDRRIMEYLAAKFSTLRADGERSLVRMEIAFHVPSGEGRLLLHQREGAFGTRGLGPIVGAVRLSMSGEKIGRVILETSSDRISASVGTGQFPGLAEGQLHEDRKYRGNVLAHGSQPELIIVGPSTLPGMNGIIGLVAEIAHGLGLQRAQLWLTDVDGDVPDFWGIRTYPAIVVRAGGHVIGLVDAAEPDEEIRSCLLAFFGEQE